MTRITISLEGVNLKEFELTKERTTLGRRPYNDIVIDHLAVSGEHAVFVQKDGHISIEDLHSTNGTYVNGRAVRTAVVGADDQIEIGRYRISVLPAGHVPTPPAEPEPPAMAPAVAPASAQIRAARIRVINGPASGREMPLIKVVTTLGKPGVAVAAITQRGSGYTLTLVDGDKLPTVNGQAVTGQDPVTLKHNDVINLAGTEMLFQFTAST
jgi:pSer/pThr/pTyr-binding forkhead associated (FHA) protein